MTPHHSEPKDVSYTSLNSHRPCLRSIKRHVTVPALQGAGGSLPRVHEVILSPSIRGDRKTPTKHDRPGDFTSRKIQVWKIQMYKKLK